MRYYVRAFFGGWKEVSKEEADNFIDRLLKSAIGVNTEDKRKNFIKRHYKEVR